MIVNISNNLTPPPPRLTWLILLLMVLCHCLLPDAPGCVDDGVGGGGDGEHEGIAGGQGHTHRQVQRVHLIYSTQLNGKRNTNFVTLKLA